MADEEIFVERLSYEDLRRRAAAFLDEHHASGTIPVPIEEIVEFRLKMDIVPVESLQRLLDIEGFTASDLSSIFVDEFVYSHRENRYRFTLAHEVGHFVLHGDVYRKAGFRKAVEWKAFINSIPEETHGWMEWQAYCFAGLTLVPASPLDQGIRNCIAQAQKSGVDLEANADFAWDRFAQALAKRFFVSSQVIEKRFQYDRVRDRFPFTGK